MQRNGTACFEAVILTVQKKHLWLTILMRENPSKESWHMIYRTFTALTSRDCYYSIYIASTIPALKTPLVTADAAAGIAGLEGIFCPDPPTINCSGPRCSFPVLSRFLADTFDKSSIVPLSLNGSRGCAMSCTCSQRERSGVKSNTRMVKEHKRRTGSTSKPTENEQTKIKQRPAADGTCYLQTVSPTAGKSGVQLRRK